MGTPLIIGNRCAFTSSTTGTGTYAVASALDGYLAPANAAIADGSRVPYVAVDNPGAPTVVEIGEGVLSSGSPWTLSRATIRRTIIAGVAGSSAVNWPPGTRTILISPNVANLPLYDTDGMLRALNIPKAWIRFNGSTIVASAGVASVTDNGVGDFTVNFAEAFANANYAIIGTASYAAGEGAIKTVSPRSDGSSIAAGSCRILCGYHTDATGVTLVDVSAASVAFFGSLP